MTREEAKRRAELYSALADGKTIQFQNSNGTWEDIKKEVLNHLYENYKYRIKPEPKYRPFKTQEECWNEMLKHQPFGWLKNKKSGGFALIGSIYKGKEVWFVWVTNGGNAYKAYDLFNDYVFADGTPFGIKEE